MHNEATIRRNSQNCQNVLPHDEDSEVSVEANQPVSGHSCLFPLQDDEGDGMIGKDSVEKEIDGHLNNDNIIIVLPCHRGEW
jgi:hypothetical protein